MTSPRLLLAFAALALSASLALFPVLARAAQPEGLHSFAELYHLAVGEDYSIAEAAAAPRPAARMPVSFQIPDAAAFESASAGASSPPAASSPAAAASAPAATLREGAYVFSTGAWPRPGRWLLLLSGLALAAWVARRRLGYSL